MTLCGGAESAPGVAGGLRSHAAVWAAADSALPILAQSVEDITRILHEAQSPPAGPAGWDNDEYIDDAMDQEQYESSFDEWGMGTSI